MRCCASDASRAARSSTIFSPGVPPWIVSPSFTVALASGASAGDGDGAPVIEAHRRARRARDEPRLGERAGAGVAHEHLDGATLALVEDAVAIAGDAVVAEHRAHQLDVVSVDEALHHALVVPAVLGRADRADARAAPRERRPEDAEVLLVGGQRRGEQRVARLEQGRIGRGELQRRDEVALHLVLRDEEVAARIAEQPHVALPQHGGPDLAGVVHLGVEATVLAEADRHGGERLAVRDVLERERVLREVDRVGDAAEAEVVVGAPARGRVGAARVHARPARAARHARLIGAARQEERDEVAPALAEPPGLVGGETVAVGDEAAREHVAPLVRDDVGVERAVDIDERRAVHDHVDAAVEGGLDGLPVGERERERRDVHARARASHVRRGRRIHRARDVDDDHADRARALRVERPSVRRSSGRDARRRSCRSRCW